MTPSPHRSSTRPTLVGDSKIPLEEFGRLSVRDLAALPGSYSGPEGPHRTELGELFETLTSNVAPGEYGRVSIDDVYKAARTLAVSHGEVGRGILVHALLVWSAPQIHDACRAALRPLACGGDAFVHEAFGILADRAAEVRRSILAVEGDSLLGERRLKDEGHLVASERGLSELFDKLRETMAGRALGALRELEKEGLLSIVAVAQPNPGARVVGREERAEQLRGMLHGSDFDEKSPERQDRMLAFYDAEQSAQEGQRPAYDRSVAIFLLPRCSDLSVATVRAIADGIAARAGIDLPFGGTTVNAQTLALHAQALTGAWERKMGEAMAIRAEDLTPATFLQWQDQVKRALGLAFEPVHASGRVTLPELREAQGKIFGELRLGELRAQRGGGYAFEPKEYVPELTVAGLGRITWAILQAHRDRFQSEVCQKTIDTNTFHTWTTALCSHLHVERPHPFPRSVLLATTDLLEQVLVVDGELRREVQKAFWDDEWFSAAQLWYGVEKMKGEAFRGHFGVDGILVGAARGSVERPLQEKETVAVGTQVFLCKDQTSAERAAQSIADKGRLPRYKPGTL